jgi:hypothetical protein
MPQINQLSTISASQLTGSDNLPVYSSANGDARKLAISALIAYFQDNFTKQDYLTTVSTPANGFTETVTQDGFSRWILLRPTGALATGTIVLPSPSVAVDGQEILVTNTLQITSLTVNGNGATAVYGAPSALSAEDKFTLRYNTLTTSWYGIK